MLVFRAGRDRAGTLQAEGIARLDLDLNLKSFISLLIQRRVHEIENLAYVHVGWIFFPLRSLVLEISPPFFSVSDLLFPYRIQA